MRILALVVFLAGVLFCAISYSKHSQVLEANKRRQKQNQIANFNSRGKAGSGQNQGYNYFAPDAPGASEQFWESM